LSLEDALLRVFTRESVVAILRKLGMRDDEPIESAMVARRIQVAQQKFESRFGRELPANSAEEWIERNAPQD
jgi:preprotein translocase subunit SecA